MPPTRRDDDLTGSTGVLPRSRWLALAGAALAVAAPRRASAQSGPVLRVAANGGDAYAEAIYANDQGFFEKAGLNVELSIINSGSAIAAAVASGTIDIGVSNIIPIALGFLGGIPFAYFCSGGMYNADGAAICVSSDGPIRGAKDLDGKTIATSALVDINSLAIRAWVDRNGGDSTTLHLLEMPSAAMAAALSRGTVAAAPLSEPILSNTKKSGGIRLIDPHLYDVFGTNCLTSGWFARTDWLKANPALARRFADVIYDTGRWANSHPQDSAAILVKVAKLDPESAHGMSRTPYGATLNPGMLQTMLDLAYKYKIISRAVAGSQLIVRV